MFKKCTALRREANFQVKMLLKTPFSEHFWKSRCSNCSKRSRLCIAGAHKEKKIEIRHSPHSTHLTHLNHLPGYGGKQGKQGKQGSKQGKPIIPPFASRASGASGASKASGASRASGANGMNHRSSFCLQV